jgi:hypothetical protein
MTKSQNKSKTKSTSTSTSKSKSKSYSKNKKGGAVYSSDDYKDVGVLDGLKFSSDDFKTGRADLPPFPGCSIM